jgi:hypothetical protein
MSVLEVKVGPELMYYSELLGKLYFPIVFGGTECTVEEISVSWTPPIQYQLAILHLSDKRLVGIARLKDKSDYQPNELNNGQALIAVMAPSEQLVRDGVMALSEGHELPKMVVPIQGFIQKDVPNESWHIARDYNIGLNTVLLLIFTAAVKAADDKDIINLNEVRPLQIVHNMVKQGMNRLERFMR